MQLSNALLLDGFLMAVLISFFEVEIAAFCHDTLPVFCKSVAAATMGR
jgi:hypothetical protein